MLAEWLRDAREKADKPRRAAAVLLDVTEKTIERWEDPKAPNSLPNVAQFFRLAAFYSADVKYLLARKFTGDAGGSGRARAAGED